MTNSDHIPPHLRDHIARAYAHGRLDATHPGDPWLHVGEFIRAVLRERPATLNSVHQLYDAMLAEGTHVYGGTGATTAPARPTGHPGRRRYMDHSRCPHPATAAARGACRHSAKMAGTWPTPVAH